MLIKPFEHFHFVPARIGEMSPKGDVRVLKLRDELLHQHQLIRIVFAEMLMHVSAVFCSRCLVPSPISADVVLDAFNCSAVNIIPIAMTDTERKTAAAITGPPHHFVRFNRCSLGHKVSKGQPFRSVLVIIRICGEKGAIFHSPLYLKGCPFTND
jgi:hypothetical protein